MMDTSDEMKELLSKGTFISYENCVYLGGDCNIGKSTLASILIGEEISQHCKSTDGIYFMRNGIDLKNKEMVPLKQATIQENIKEEIRKGTYKIEIAPSDLIDFGGQRSFDMTHQLFMRLKGTFVLMFNGKIEEEITILKHWVNSILSYCADDEDILPMIMFFAIHSVNQEDRKDRKKELIHDLGEIFKNHKRQHHIICNDIFFINREDESDPEINRLKSKLVEVACKQKSWGKRMSMAWVPLDLQMSELRLHNMNIISIEELITLNQRNEDLALNVKQIKYFLNVQHSLGKIIYFDQQGLDNFIIVQPQSLVNILRSFITDELFWPKDEELRGITPIAKQDLLKLWSQKKFHQHMPNDDFKEFIIQVLVHLDILVEQESKVQSYFVPCIVKRRLPVTDFYEKSADKMICLSSYTLLKSSIPAALSCKLIGAAMNDWPLKKTPEGFCLYHQAAILCIDESNDLHLLVKDDKVFVFLINKEKKSSIPTSVVQTCLIWTMTKVLEFYHKSFGKSLSTSEVEKAFEIEVREWCTSGYISVPEVKEKTEWRCQHNKTHDTTCPLYKKCVPECPALIKKPLQDVCCVEGEIACLSCDIIEDETAVTWYKDDIEIIPSTDIILKVHSKIHELSIPRTEMKDGGRYSIKVKQSTSEAKLTVKAFISNPLVDTTCLEGSTIVLICEVSVEDIGGILYEDDSILVQSSQIYPTVNGRIHQLIIFQGEIKDDGKYVFKIRDKMSSAILTVKDKSTIPDQILLMNEKDKEMYLEIIKSGTEKRFYIRLMIVGENGVGKTCLMRNLLEEKIDDVTSTDGIDVVTRRCKIRLSDGTWILNTEDTKEQSRNARMMKALTGTPSPEAERRHNQVAPTSLVCIPIENKATPFGKVLDESLVKNGTEITHIYTGKDIDQANDTDVQVISESVESLAKSVQLHEDKDIALKSERHVRLSDTLSGAMKVKKSGERFADCSIWDFAGQKEFYATHQAFLTNSAIYLLTTDLSKEPLSKKMLDKELDEVGCYLRFWFDTIHCYATKESPDDIQKTLEPPIIVVCTGTDKVKGDIKNQRDLFTKYMSSISKKETTFRHVTYIHYLSNKKDVRGYFSKLREDILRTAKNMSSWGKQLPLRWIHWEAVLDDEHEAGSNILPFRLVADLLAKNDSLHTCDDDQISLFLRYQHECGHVIFFEALPDFVILNPRWLIDAFKCLVSAPMFQEYFISSEELKELKETGKLTDTVFSKLFEKGKDLGLRKCKEHLLQVLEKFDIIVKPYKIQDVTSYYMPCLIRPSSFDDICSNFGVHKPSCHRTSWLLLEFEFLPPAFFNHILVDYIRTYKVSDESTKDGGRLSFYRGIGVFDYEETGCKKLVICAHTDLIAVQIWMFSEASYSVFHQYPQILTQMVDTLSKRYQICCKYKVKMKCSASDYQKTEGRKEYKDLQGCNDYYCPEHKSAHHSSDVYKYWFVDQNKSQQEKEKEKAQELEKKNKLIDEQQQQHQVLPPNRNGNEDDDKEQDKCDVHCPGLEKRLALCPELKHLFRLAQHISLDECYRVVKILRLSDITWSDIQNTNEYDIPIKKFRALHKWRDQVSKPTFQHLYDALAEMKKEHVLCQVFREDVTAYGDANRELQESPKDDVLQDVARHVGDCAIHLGLELGLEMTAIEDTLVLYQNDMKGQILDVMTKWKSSSEVKTIRMLMKAFHSAEPRGYKFLREKYR